MKKILNFITNTGKEVPVNIKLSRYAYGNNLCVELVNAVTMESYCYLTTNILSCSLPCGFAYLDLNNVPEALAFCERYGLCKNTGIFGASGYCRYPLVSFDCFRLKAWSINGYPERRKVNEEV